MPTMTRAGYVPEKKPEPPKPPKKPAKKKKRKKRGMSGAAIASLVVFALAVCIGAATLLVYKTVEDSADVFCVGQSVAGHPLGGRTRAQGEALLGLEAALAAALQQALHQRAGEHAEHLLAHHVRGLADAVHEGGHLLDRGRLDPVEAVGDEELPRRAAHALPRAHVATIQILGALYPLCHSRPLSDVQSATYSRTTRAGARRAHETSRAGPAGRYRRAWRLRGHGTARQPPASPRVAGGRAGARLRTA